MAFIEKGQEIDMEVIKAETQLSAEALRLKESRDRELADIISGEDDRILLVIGPCSSDNEEAVLEYARRLSALQKKVADKIFMVMRVYTAKPRTNGDGYKGLVHQPDTSKAPSLINGLQAVRQLHYRVITETGLTTADEMLYPSNLILVDDLVSYHAVGARSVEDQEHRFVASGIDAPVGMKNPTSGNLGVMFNAIYAAQNKQTFLYHGQEVETSGNPLSHVILRGAVNEYGNYMPNYYYENLLQAIERYEAMGLENPFILIDTNHDNSGKQYMEQIRIVRQTLQNRDWNEKIKKTVRGFMIESYLADGRQNQPEVFDKISEKDGVGESQLLLMKMIVGHGIDIEELASIESAVTRHEGFAKRVLTAKEMERFNSLKGRRQIEYLAGRWSAKEAFSKAMGTGIGKLGFQDLEVLSNERGAPYFSQAPFSGKIWLSISHTDQFVTASVILEENHES